MSTRRGTREKRCPKCMVHFENCYCAKIEHLNINTKLSVILFKKEKFLPSNTAQLSINSLQNSEMFFRGFKDQVLQESFIDEKNYQPLYLFPSEDATELTATEIANFDKPINLIVPDGTWRQAKKIHLREPLLKDIPRVKLNIGTRSIYPLRRQKYEYGLCTHEAIAHAMGIIESEEIKNKLIKNLEIMIEAHLKNRPIFEKEKRNPYL